MITNKLLRSARCERQTRSLHSHIVLKPLQLIPAEQGLELPATFSRRDTRRLGCSQFRCEGPEFRRARSHRAVPKKSNLSVWPFAKDLDFWDDRAHGDEELIRCAARHPWTLPGFPHFRSHFILLLSHSHFPNSLCLCRAEQLLKFTSHLSKHCSDGVASLPLLAIVLLLTAVLLSCFGLLSPAGSLPAVGPLPAAGSPTSGVLLS